MTWILFYLLDNCKLLLMDVGIFEKLHLGPEIWPFEKLSRNPSLCLNFGTKLKVSSLNGHSSAPRGPNDPDPFSTARVWPDADIGH